jgi:hypothetical protein
VQVQLSPLPDRAQTEYVPRNAHGASDPPVAVNPRQVDMLRAADASWQTISQQLGIGVGTACRALQPPSKNLSESALVSA